jgi:DNA-binding MarR family transcriptional regulator
MVAYYNKALEPLGITAHQLMALGVLWQAPKISLGEFALRAGIGKAAAVTMIQRLAAMGLVEAKPHATDGRLTVITLTNKAWELAPQVAKQVEALENRLEEALGPKRLETLTQSLDIIRALKLD